MNEKEYSKDLLIKARVSENEKRYIKSKADYCNLTVSEYLRKMAISGIVIKRDTSQLIKILNELNRIGNNVNQIAKVIHQQGDYISEDNYVDIKDQFDEMKNIIIGKVLDATFDYEARINEIAERNVNSKTEFDSAYEEFMEIFEDIDPSKLEDDFDDYDEGAFV